MRRFIVLLSIAALSQSSCSRTTKEDCGRQIREKIVPGSTAQFAESELKQCGFKVTFESEKKSLYGDKTVRGDVVSERTQVSVNLDANDRVSSVVVTTSLTGP